MGKRKEKRRGNELLLNTTLAMTDNPQLHKQGSTAAAGVLKESFPGEVAIQGSMPFCHWDTETPLFSYSPYAAAQENHSWERIFPSLLNFPPLPSLPANCPPESTEQTEPKSTLQNNRPLSSSDSQKLPAPGAGAYGKNCRKGRVIFTAGYYHEPPLRGQFTACPEHYINSLMVFQRCSIAYCP